MEIDLSPLTSSLNNLLIGLVKVLGIPFIGVLVIGFVLRLMKVPRKIVILVASLLFIYGMFQMFKIIDLS